MKKNLCIIFAALILLTSCATYDGETTASTEATADTSLDADTTVAVGTAPVQESVPIELTRDEKWIEDILQMKDIIVTKHLDPFFYTSQYVFDANIAELIENVPTLTDTEVWLSIFQIVNSIRDAHSVIFLGEQVDGQFKFDFGFFPFAVQKIKEEYYVVAISPDYNHLWKDIEGLRITSINGADIKEIDSSLYGFLPSDAGSKNSMNAYVLTFFTPTFLQFLGYPISDTNTITFCKATGETLSVEVKSTSNPDYVKKIITILPYSEGEERFEFFPDEENGVARINYNSCVDDIAFYRFLHNTFEEITAKGYQKLVIDLRKNMGGYPEQIGQLLKHINNWKDISDNNRLYVLIGDFTSSAGVRAARQLGRVMENITYIGASTAGTLDVFMNFQTVFLEHSGLMCQISTLESGDNHYVLLPDINAENDIDDYIAGRDVAMEWVISQP